jgi:hypothetical protein
MTYEKLDTMSRIYNTLLLINTKGEDTMVMGDCLRALKSFILNEQKELEVAMNTKATTDDIKAEIAKNEEE